MRPMDAGRQSDSMHGRGSGGKRIPEPRYLVVGRVLRPHGIRGEVRVEVLTAYPERLPQHTEFYLAAPDTPQVARRYPVEGLRWHREVLLVKLGGCDSRNDAEDLRGMLVEIPIEKAVPLEEGEFYLFQVIGVAVETEDGDSLGYVVDVLETGANDVYVVRGPYGEVLLPDIEEVILSLDVDERKMVVRLLPGTL